MKTDPNDIVTLLRRRYDTRIALNYTTPFQLAVAVILSAQCTDKKVNSVTSAFFPLLQPDEAKTLAQMPLADIERHIFATGFYHAKARAIKGFAQKYLEYNHIPNDMGTFLTFPGIGRKSANVILGELYNGRYGIVVDTHVRRIVQRLRLVPTYVHDFDRTYSPEKIEKHLMKTVKKELWRDLPHLLIKLGRDCCTARKPRCSDCILNTTCPVAFRV